MLVVLAGCISDAAIQRLSLAEQSEFYVYRHMMTGNQERVYLAQANAAERTAYLRSLGLIQRFQALDPEDREAVLSGWPRQGMSAEALHFVWGMPHHTDGDARLSAHWHYLGSSFARGHASSTSTSSGNQVDVYLVAGKVVGWVDVAPSSQDDNGDGTRR
jgi:hypothetical protein